MYKTFATGTQNYPPAQAKVRILKRTPGTAFRVSQSDSIVAPVVNTSSINKRCLPDKAEERRVKPKMESTFSIRAQRSKRVWEGLLRTRLTAFRQTGIPLIAATPRASHSL